ncbi:hypothetical protein [Parasitella parasitica]|uniref:Uncharacterized protein n=1 Tax=Parasitella parasitica TaxID=35722 RepID=A0A0B7N707_9FUNG|nr:hypothetical protein [Parasitella parasitica]
MASSAKDHNGIFKGPKSFQQNKKLWSAVITGGSHTDSSVMSVSPTHHQPSGELEPLTSSAVNPPPVDHFLHKVARPYLTGSVAHSILIDITKVFDRQKDIIAVSEHMRRDNDRIYAEISVSPTMYQRILETPALQLENFDEPLMAYPTFHRPPTL